MTDFQQRAWVSVDLDKLTRNMERIRKMVRPQTQIMGVVKADAYGHGDKEIARTLEKQGLISWFGVSRLEEGLALRDYGISLPILIFGITPAQYAATMVRYKLTPTLHSLEYALALNEALEGLGETLSVHIKLDTGMSRMGFLVYDSYREQSLADIEAVCRLPQLDPQGLYTHFAVSDTYNDACVDFTRFQYENYTSARTELTQRGLEFPVCHVSNSAAIVSYPEMNLDMVRSGIITYGLYPSTECKGELELEPVMEFYGSVVMVKEIPVGATVSYGREFTAQRPTLVANVGIGYADGYDRIFSNRGEMLVRGKRVPVIGRICMDQLMLDVTDVPGVEVGDLVTVVGTQGEESVSFQELADMTQTIHYEKTSAIGKRVPRVYYQNGEPVEVVDLLRGHSCGFEGTSLL